MTKLFTYWTTLKLLCTPAPTMPVEVEEEIIDFDLAPYLGWMEAERELDF